MDKERLKRVSLINIICVLGKIPQKQEIKYKKKINNKLLKIKNIANLIFKNPFILTDLSIFIFRSFSCLIDIKCFSDKENCFNNILIIVVIKEENIIFGNS